MIKVLIIEDEPLAATRLAELLLVWNQDMRVLETLDSVEDSVHWFRQNPAPDLILMDIHLADGVSFNIFNYVQVTSPIIFTTGYEQYAIEAFKVNSIDYLLKPISYQHLARALQKWQTWTNYSGSLQADQHQTAAGTQKVTNHYKSRFLIRFGDHIQYKNATEVAYFYAEGKTVYLVSFDGRRFVIDYTLEELEDLLDPACFFRLNRKVITQIGAVRDVKAYAGGRLKMQLQPQMEGEVLISRERVPDFKNWLDH